MGEDKRMMTGECGLESASGIMWVGAFFSDNLFSKKNDEIEFFTLPWNGKRGNDYLFCYLLIENTFV